MADYDKLLQVPRGTKARLETIKLNLLVNTIVYATDTKELGIKLSDGNIEYFKNATDIDAIVDTLETSKQDKLVAGDNIIIDENNVISASDEIDLNMLGYMNYAADIFYRGRSQSLFENAWEHSLTVDPLEISENSSSSNKRGTAQYPNGAIEGVIIPNSVTSIGDDAFRDWTSNNQPLVIPNSVTSIGTNAFYDWSFNNQPLVIPDSVTSIGNSAFSGWNSNKQPLVIPNSVTSIGNSAFGYWQSNNQPLVIPNSVTSIGLSVFQDWRANNHPLVIPNSVTSIGNNAFRNWNSAKEFIMESETPPTITNSSFSNTNDAPIYVPNGSVEAYKAATNWVELADRIFPISDKDNIYTKGEIDLMIGDIESALDAILGV